MRDDRELMGRIAQGDEAAMATLYKRHHDPLFAFLMARGADQALAADLLHDTMLDVWHGAGRYSGQASAKTWIFAIARNKHVDRIRKDVRLVVSDSVPEVEDDAATPEAAALAAAEAGRVRACVEALTAAHRTVIRLAFFEDLSYDEISAIEDVPVGTVKTRIYHAKKLLMRCLGG
ncbi:MAG: sigma-70 family RNA polymerase sigma factor [Pseudomonadota bacterium]